MLLQMVFGNSPEKISLVIFIPTLKPNALGLNVIKLTFNATVFISMLSGGPAGVSINSLAAANTSLL